MNINVSYKNKPLGIFSWNSRENTYSFEFFEGLNISPEELSPVIFSKIDPNKVIFKDAVDSILCSSGFFPLFKDSLPYGFSMKILNYYISSIEKLSPAALLSLCGDRATGAFGFHPQGFPELDSTSEIDLDTIFNTVKHIYNKDQVLITKKKLRDLLRCSVFTRGKRPKSMLHINDFTGTVISGQGIMPEGFDPWIIYFDGIIKENETYISWYNNYRVACDCGISVVESRLIKDGRYMHLLVKRLDRNKDGKVHIQSFASLRDNVDNSYEALFRCMRQLKLPYSDMEEMFKRMVFNFYIGNKNFRADKILFEYNDNKRNWSLAPSLILYQSNYHKKTLTLNGKPENITNTELESFGKDINIKKAKKIIHEVRLHIIDRTHI